tara:strand:+ start:854 stop:1354 length:501 start_codon:yes stop_codon:yes gene_type:complete
MAKNIKPRPMNAKNNARAGDSTQANNPMGGGMTRTDEPVTDQICHLHQQSVRLNKQMSEQAEISRNMLEVLMAQNETLNSINERLKLLENLTTINSNIEASTRELDKLEDVMREHAEDQRKNTDLFVETSHAMIEAFNGTDKEQAVEKGIEKAKEKRAECDAKKKS